MFDIVKFNARRPLSVALSLCLAACNWDGTGNLLSVSGTSKSQGPTKESANDYPTAYGLNSAIRSNGETVAATSSLGSSASITVVGVPEVPVSVAATPRGVEGARTFHVNSRVGDDRNDGTAETPGTAGAGPWRTLARVMQSDLGPGDTLLLACDSEWNETLRLPVSGTPERPIVVAARSTGCNARPTINGSIALPPAAWTRHSGSVYKTPLDVMPLQLFSASGTWAEAHHPNRGQLADSTSIYLALAADSRVESVVGRPATTVLTTGTDLTLPAGVSLAPGTRVRVRTTSWLLDDSTIASINGSQLTLMSPTTYPVAAGWGYFLLGQLWMVDSAGEWFYDAASKQLYAWMPNSGEPTAPVLASVLATGIDLQNKEHVIVDGIAVRKVGLGIALQQSKGVQVRNSRIEDTMGSGIAAAASTSAVLDANSIARTGSDAIDGGGRVTQASTKLTARNNIIRDSGVLMQAEQVISLPRLSYAAILAGDAAVVSGNVIINAGYTGVRLGSGSVAENNFVYGACTVLNDCGGIYSWGTTAVAIRGNTVVHSRGGTQGMPVKGRATAAQGIYLDDFASGATVQDNVVVDADHGIQLHITNNSIIRGNRLYGNRVSQVWMQETHNRVNANGDIFGNVVESNQMAPTMPGASGLRLQTNFASTASFGSFDRNRYYDRVSPVVAQVITASDSQTFGLAQWRQSRNAGSSVPVDSGGSGVSASSKIAYSVNGTNLVANSSLSRDAAGWAAWNEVAPPGLLTREVCPPGMCLRYVAGGSAGLVSSPNFSVLKGQWYRLTVDLATEQDNQPVQLVVRRGGGASNGYESLSSESLTFLASRGWARFSMLFRANNTITARDSLTGDLGARVDFEVAGQGRSVSLANLEVVPVVPDPNALYSIALVNAGAAPATMNCPLTLNQLGACDKLSQLANDQPVVWPLTLAPYGSAILYVRSPG